MKESRTSDLPSVEELAALYVLDSLKGFGPQKFKALHLAKVAPSAVLGNPALLPVAGKRGDPIRKQLEAAGRQLYETCLKRAEKQIQAASQARSLILTYGSPSYPKTVFGSNNPVPILYIRGNAELLASEKTVACVGSRNILAPYNSLHARFVETACREGFAIVSGFALGADTIGHRTAHERGGTTVCVMPSGLDRPFPPENRALWNQFLDSPNVVFASEFPFGTGAASLNLRKRNKLIVAFSLGVLVSQSSTKGGAMNAYRFAVEQKKPIATFSGDGTEDTSGNATIASSGTAFACTASDEGDLEFVKWLRRLSSST